MIIKPRKNQILVKPDPEPAKETENGLVRPDNEEQERKAIGTVEAVGPDIKDVKKGDRIIFGAFAGEKIEFEKENTEFLLLFDEDVLAFIEE